tara:strand:+ start:2040 stop:2723 length:684 start_codon:yes stop_codon:yes gene_type:complete
MIFDIILADNNIKHQYHNDYLYIIEKLKNNNIIEFNDIYKIDKNILETIFNTEFWRFGKYNNKLNISSLLHFIIKHYKKNNCPKLNYILMDIINNLDLDLNISDSYRNNYLYTLTKGFIDIDNFNLIKLIILKGGNLFKKNKLNKSAYKNLIINREKNDNNSIYKNTHILLNEVLKLNICMKINKFNFNYKLNLHYLAYNSMNYNDKKIIKLVNMSNNIYYNSKELS